MGQLLVLGLKECLLKCVTACIKSEVILTMIVIVLFCLYSIINQYHYDSVVEMQIVEVKWYFRRIPVNLFNFVKNVHIFRYTYDTFSHKKSVLIRDFGMIGEKLGDCRYPPYSRGNVGTFRTLMKISHIPSPPGWLKYALVFGLGMGTAVALKVRRYL